MYKLYYYFKSVSLSQFRLKCSIFFLNACTRQAPSKNFDFFFFHFALQDKSWNKFTSQVHIQETWLLEVPSHLSTWNNGKCHYSTRFHERFFIVKSQGQAGSIPWSRKGQPTPVFLHGYSLGQRNLAGYSSWGRKETDTAEHLEGPRKGRFQETAIALLSARGLCRAAAATAEDSGVQISSL